MITKAEMSKALAILQANYFTKDMTRQEAEGKINLWMLMLSDVEQEELMLAIKKIIATSQYFPTVSQVREVIAEIKQSYPIDAGAAWGEVVAAIRNYGYYQANEALESMSKITRTIVERMGWQELCISKDMNIDRAHFLKIYQAEEQRQKENALLPLEVQQNIAQKQLIYQEQRKELEQKQLEQKQLEEQKRLENILPPSPKKQNDFVSMEEMFAKARKELFG